MRVYGYARVSTADQNTDAQERELREAGCDEIYVDHAISGVASNKPELENMLSRIRKGDCVMVWKLDRLGRNTRDLLDLLEELNEKGAAFRSLRDGISTDPTGTAMERAMATAMLTIISAFATLERDQLIERTKAGLETARANGRVGGRPRVDPGNKDVQKAKELREKGLSIEDIRRHLARDIRRANGKVERNVPVSRATVYRYLSL